MVLKKYKALKDGTSILRGTTPENNLLSFYIGPKRAHDDIPNYQKLYIVDTADYCIPFAECFKQITVNKNRCSNWDSNCLSSCTQSYRFGKEVFLVFGAFSRSPCLYSLQRSISQQMNLPPFSKNPQYLYCNWLCFSLAQCDYQIRRVWQ